MRILSIDFGTKIVGLAISDGESSIAHKYGIINFKDMASLASEIANIINKEAVDLVLLGNPISMSGSSSKMSEKIAEFKAVLEKSIKIPVELIDERLSSKEAEGNVGTRNKEDINKEAARLILQKYLDKLFAK